MAKVLHRIETGWMFYCPGCRCGHGVWTDHKVATANWQFNGDEQKPTFSPSIKITGVQPTTDAEVDRLMAGEKFDPKPLVCHSFVRNGRIEFLGDCTHELAGKTVDLEPVDRW